MPDRADQSESAALVQHALELYESPLIAYVTGILGGDEDRARDVVQDAFIKLFQSDPERVRDNVKAWLYTVSRNRALDVLRKEQRMDVGNEDAVANLDDWRPNPAQSTDSHELCDRVWELVENLTPNQREVIRLKFMNDSSYKEIASITGLSIGNVGFIMHTAIKKLREMLNRELSEHPRATGNH